MPRPGIEEMATPEQYSYGFELSTDVQHMITNSDLSALRGYYSSKRNSLENLLDQVDEMEAQ